MDTNGGVHSQYDATCCAVIFWQYIAAASGSSASESLSGESSSGTTGAQSPDATFNCPHEYLEQRPA